MLRWLRVLYPSSFLLVIPLCICPLCAMSVPLLYTRGTFWGPIPLLGLEQSDSSTWAILSQGPHRMAGESYGTVASPVHGKKMERKLFRSGKVHALRSPFPLHPIPPHPAPTHKKTGASKHYPWVRGLDEAWGGRWEFRMLCQDSLACKLSSLPLRLYSVLSLESHLHLSQRRFALSYHLKFMLELGF